MRKYLKNIAYEETVRLSELVSVQKGQVISKTLVQNEALSITVFAFSKGEEIGTHDSNGDALVTVLDGTGKFTVDGIDSLLEKGESCYASEKTACSLSTEDFKMLLTVVFQ